MPFLAGRGIPPGRMQIPRNDNQPGRCIRYQVGRVFEYSPLIRSFVKHPGICTRYDREPTTETAPVRACESSVKEPPIRKAELALDFSF